MMSLETFSHATLCWTVRPMPLGSQFSLGNNWHISLLPITKMKAGKLCQSQVSVQPYLLTISESTDKGLHKIFLLIPQKPGFLRV